MSEVIELTHEIIKTTRTSIAESRFGMSHSRLSRTTTNMLPIERLTEREWNVGLIVGPSGAGKSTVASRVFPQMIDSLEWDTSKSLLDDFAPHLTFDDIAESLSAVGFASPPTWLRPFHTLSNGEQFRAFLARLLAESSDSDDPVVVDEFTSVVDRTVAKVASAALSKLIRRQSRKFVAVSVHYDVLDWLQPDWVFEPHSGVFSWRSVQPRPGIRLDFRRGEYADWKIFARHHYLDSGLNRSARLVVAEIDERPAALCAVLALPSGTVRNAFRVSRIVVIPDFQGVGVARAVLNEVGATYKYQGRRLYLSTSHPTMTRSLNSDENWRLLSLNRNSRHTRESFRRTGSNNRMTASFKYYGDARDVLAECAHVVK